MGTGTTRRDTEKRSESARLQFMIGDPRSANATRVVPAVKGMMYMVSRGTTGWVMWLMVVWLFGCVCVWC